MHESDFMLASPANIAVEQVDLNAWTFDLKMDGVRVAMQWDGWTCKLWSRSGADVSEFFPEITLSARALGTPCVLDGELVATDGDFDAIAQRSRTRLGHTQALARSNPAQFFAFDCLEYDTVDLTSLPWTARRERVEQIIDPRRDVHWHTTVVSKDPGYPGMTRQLDAEGVIAKLDRGTYLAGIRAKTWLKFKNRHRVYAIASSYTKGNGSRAATFGALELTMLDAGGQFVPVGRVGSGIPNADLLKIKRSIDSGIAVIVEVECLGLTKHRQLRQPTVTRVLAGPTYRDCTTEQLHDLPTTN